jgi:23S rRNA G2445 N2-methylase RlmL
MQCVKSELRESHRVLDPFCGSGTLLIERAWAGTCQELVGIDISSKALEAAGKNAQASGFSNIEFIQCDMRKAAYDNPFDEVITNLPFGLRVGTHQHNETLYRDFFSILPKILRSSGLVVLYTQEIRLTQELFDSVSRVFELLSVHRIHTGGLQPAVFIARKCF